MSRLMAGATPSVRRLGPGCRRLGLIRPLAVFRMPPLLNGCVGCYTVAAMSACRWNLKCFFGSEASVLPGVFERLPYLDCHAWRLTCFYFGCSLFFMGASRSQSRFGTLPEALNMTKSRNREMTLEYHVQTPLCWNKHSACVLLIL